jgi:hypothetical protein
MSNTSWRCPRLRPIPKSKFKVKLTVWKFHIFTSRVERYIHSCLDCNFVVHLRIYFNFIFLFIIHFCNTLETFSKHSSFLWTALISYFTNSCKYIPCVLVLVCPFLLTKDHLNVIELLVPESLLGLGPFKNRMDTNMKYENPWLLDVINILFKARKTL